MKTMLTILRLMIIIIVIIRKKNDAGHVSNYKINSVRYSKNTK